MAIWGRVMVRSEAADFGELCVGGCPNASMSDHPTASRRRCMSMSASWRPASSTDLRPVYAAIVASDVFAEQVARQVGERASRLDVRERELDTRAERLRDQEVHLASWEHRIRTQ